MSGASLKCYIYVAHTHTGVSIASWACAWLCYVGESWAGMSCKRIILTSAHILMNLKMYWVESKVAQGSLHFEIHFK